MALESRASLISWSVLFLKILSHIDIAHRETIYNNCHRFVSINSLSIFQKVLNVYLRLLYRLFNIFDYGTMSFVIFEIQHIFFQHNTIYLLIGFILSSISVLFQNNVPIVSNSLVEFLGLFINSYNLGVPRYHLF